MATVMSSKSMPELESFFRNLQTQTLTIISLLFTIISVLLYGFGFQNLENSWYFIVATGLWITAGLTWLIRRHNFFLASILLVLGSLAAIYIPINLGAVQFASILFAIPAGLAMLTLDIWGGGITAALISLFLLASPNKYLPISTELRWACTLELWSIVGMLWLALRPLLNLMGWTRDAYEESQVLLKQARETQANLRQALDDAANQQLIRLNKLAQDLRSSPRMSASLNSSSSLMSAMSCTHRLI